MSSEKALSALRRGHHCLSNVEYIAMAIRGKKGVFGSAKLMIVKMGATLHAEQKKDEEKKAYCEHEFGVSDDQKKGLELLLRDTETAIEAAKGEIEKLKDETATPKEGIAALDKSVADATAQRKEEDAEYKELMSANGAAKELLGFCRKQVPKVTIALFSLFCLLP
jgi:chromosome segregation ATPase